MKTTNRLFSTIVLALLLFSATTILAQDDAPKKTRICYSDYQSLEHGQGEF